MIFNDLKIRSEADFDYLMAVWNVSVWSWLLWLEYFRKLAQMLHEAGGEKQNVL